LNQLTTHREALPAARTRTESLRRGLEADILSGVLPPGQKLDEEKIAARFGLSRTPVREALKSLMATGLVDVRPHQGAFVANVDLKDLIEMFEVMSLLEASCAELAARRLTAKDRKDISLAQEECESPRSFKDPPTFYRANIRFHDAIYRAAHNGFLAAQTQALCTRLEPYRLRITYHSGLIEKSNREHRLILEAIFSMDDERARAAMTHHLTSLREDAAMIVDVMKSLSVADAARDQAMPTRTL
jgi:DNA-binding GntR family transcriptional regulator